MKNLPGAYIPRCTDQGEFAPTQCNIAGKMCWCVNVKGQEVPGTRSTDPDCSQIGE